MASAPTVPNEQGIQNVTSSSFYYAFNRSLDNNGAAISDYYIQVATNSSYSGATTYSGAPPGLTISGLNRVTQYWVRSRARNSAGYSPWSQGFSVKTAAVAPQSAPRGTYIDAQGQTGIHFIFTFDGDDGGTPIREYQVAWSTGNNPDATGTYAFNNNGDIFINNLSRYTYYNVWVRARNDVGYGPWSNALGQRTHAYVPSPPTINVLDNVTQTSVHLQFYGNDDGGAPVQEWQIGYGTDSNNVQYTTGSGGDSTIGNLSPYTTWYFWARGRNEEGWSGWSNRVQARTQAGAKVRESGVWRDAIPYVKENGVWRLARPFVKRVGLWKTTE